MDDLVIIARIRKAHGVKGEVLAELMTFDPSRFDRLEKVYLRKEDNVRMSGIEAARIVPQGILLKLQGIDDKTEADTLRGAEICIDATERLKLPDHEAYIDEVIGMQVIDADTNQRLGEVVAVHSYPAGTVYDIRMDDGALRSVTKAGNEIISLSRSARTVRVRLLEEY